MPGFKCGIRRREEYWNKNYSYTLLNNLVRTLSESDKFNIVVLEMNFHTLYFLQVLKDAFNELGNALNLVAY